MVLSTRTDVEHAARRPATHGSGNVRLWVALGLPPLAWFAAQNVGYFFVAWACARSDGEWVLHAIAAIAILLCGGAGLLSLGLLRDVGRDGPDDHDDRVQRVRFLARVGVAGAIIFALIVLTQWIAIVLLDPCQPWPRGRFSPDALRPPVERIDYTLS